MESACRPLLGSALTQLVDQSPVGIDSSLPGMRVLIPLTATLEQLQQGVPQSSRIPRRHQQRARVILDRFDQSANGRHDHRQSSAHGDVQWPRRRGTMVGQDHGVCLLEISLELGVSYVAVYTLDQVRVRAAGDGLVRSCPAFPCLADHGQAESVGLITIERAERSHQVFDALKWPNDAEVQEPEWSVADRIHRDRSRLDEVVVRTMRHHAHQRVA